MLGSGHPYPMPGGAQVTFEVPNVVGLGRLGLPSGVPRAHDEFMFAGGNVECRVPERPAPSGIAVVLYSCLTPLPAAVH